MEFYRPVGLASKNAILSNAEFARELELSGVCLNAVKEAHAVSGCVHLMTFTGFHHGCNPPMVSHGAGAEMRQAIGISVFFGMLGVTLGLFTPRVLPVSLTNIRETTALGLFTGRASTA